MNAKPYTVGVLTSGGDAPGMNAAIRAVVRTASANHANVLGVLNGFEGLLNGEFRPMGARDVGSRRGARRAGRHRRARPR